MNVLHLLWYEITEVFDIPEDVRRYTIQHFMIPFYKAEKQRKRIRAICQQVPLYNGFDHAFDISKHLVEVLEMLKDPMMVIDVRIVDDRIEKYVALLYHLLNTKPGITLENALPILIVAVEVGNIHAFAILVSNKLHHHCKDIPGFIILALSSLQQISRLWSKLLINDVCVLLLYCLEMKLDTVSNELILLWSQGDTKYTETMNRLTTHLYGQQGDRLRLLLGQ